MYRKLVLATLVVVLTFAGAAAFAPRLVQAQGGNTITDIVATDGRFSSLAEALRVTGLEIPLNGPGPLTVFAPTNEAFARAANALGVSVNSLLADKAGLINLLEYHILSGTFSANDLAGQTSALTVGGANIRLANGSGGLRLNGSATVTTADVAASNGVIHVIDAIIWPPKNLLAVARDNGASTFVAAVQAAGLTSQFVDNRNEYTVFVPTNAAFEALLSDMGMTQEQLFGNAALLRTILLGHVVRGSVLADKVGTTNSATTLGGSSIIFNGGNFNDGQAQLVQQDLVAGNGVVHVINGVLIPAGGFTQTQPNQNQTQNQNPAATATPGS